MKKLAAALLCLLLICPCALADRTEDMPPLMDWAECEAMIAENGWTGSFETVEAAGIRLWVPDVYAPDEALESLMQVFSSAMTYKSAGQYHLDIFARIWKISPTEDSRLAVTTADISGDDSLSDSVPVVVNGMPGAFRIKRIENAISLPDLGWHSSSGIQLWLELTPDDGSIAFVTVAFPLNCSEEMTDMGRCILSSVQPLD